MVILSFFLSQGSVAKIDALLCRALRNEPVQLGFGFVFFVTGFVVPGNFSFKTFEHLQTMFSYLDLQHQVSRPPLQTLVF